MRQIIPYLICLLLLTTGAMAQQPPPANGIFTLKGRVVDDATGEPMAYATVAIIQFPVIEQIIKGCVTDEKGRFELKVKKGAYSLMIRSLGFRNISKPLTPDMEDVIDFGTMRMTVKAEELGVVTVKPLVEISVDEVKYDLTQDPDRETSTLHAILQKVPLMRMTPMGDIYVDAPDKTFVVVRNGKVDALFSGNINDILKALPAKGFKSVTVMLAPPERYGDVDYVVSIEADPIVRLFGMIGKTTVKANGYRGVAEIGEEVVASLNKLRFTLGGTFTNTNEPIFKQRMVQEQYKEDFTLRQSDRTEKSGEEWSLGGNFSYDLAKNHFLTWGGGYKCADSRERKEQTTFRMLGDLPPVESGSSFLKRESRESWSAKMDYQYDFPKPQRTLNIAYLYQVTPTTSREGEITPTDNLPRLLTESTSDEHTVQVHYYDPISKNINLEAGVGYIYRNYFNADDYLRKIVADPWYEDVDRYEEMDKRNHIFNGYSAINYRKKRFSADITLKADYLYDGEGTKLQMGDSVQKISEKGFSFMPEVTVAYQFSNSKLSRLEFLYRVTRHRPRLKTLSPYVDYSNPNLLIVGNPHLKRESRHVFRLATWLYGVYLNAVWMYSKNLINSYWYQDEEGRTVQSYENSGLQNSISLNCNYSYRKNGVDVMIMSGGSYSYTKNHRDEVQKKWGVVFDPSVSYTLKNQLAIGLLGGIRKEFSTGLNGTDRPLVSLSLQMRKKLLKERLEIELATGDLLHIKSKIESWVKTADFSMRQEFETRRIPLNLKASFRIGSFKVTPPRKARWSAKIDDVAPDE